MDVSFLRVSAINIKSRKQAEEFMAWIINNVHESFSHDACRRLARDDKQEVVSLSL